MAYSLATILAEVLKKEGSDLNQAQKDLKKIRGNIAGIKESRKIIAPRLRELKNERLKADRQGGGATSAAITANLNFLRQVLNDMTEELVMAVMQRSGCAGYIKSQTEKVRAIDAEWEKAKAAEPAVEASAEEVADETNAAE